MDPEIPEAGAVIDGYRFKGGDPSNESSWEALSGPEAAGFTPLGGGWWRGPDGGTYQEGRGGAMVRRAGGDAPSGSRPLVGADARARFSLNLGPLIESQNVLSSMDREGYNPSSMRNTAAAALEAIPFDGGFAARVAGGEDYNAYTQAAKTFEAAVLPIMSGAAVTPTEAQRMIRAALPQPGDSPEVLAQKSRQRELMINEVARGIGAEAPFQNTVAGEQLVGPWNPETGLPTYPRIQRLTEGAVNFDMPEGGFGGPDAPQGPGSSRDNPVDVNDREALLALGAGSWVRLADGTVVQLSGAPEVGPVQEGAVSQGGGVFTREFDPQQVREDMANERGAGPLNQLLAFTGGVADFATFGLSDEIAAGLDTVIPLNGGRPGWQYGFDDAYQYNLARERGAMDADARNFPVTRAAGQIAAGIAAAPKAAAQVGINALRSGGLLTASARGAGAGAAYGGAYGFGSGEGGVSQRAPNALQGAGVGAVAGAAAPSVVNVAQRVASPIGNALGDAARWVGRAPVNALGDRAPQALREAVLPRPLERAADRFIGTNHPNIDKMRSRVEEVGRDVGRPVPAAVGVNPGGRGLLRGVSMRSDRAREIGADFAESTVEEMPQRIGQQARRIVSPDARPVDDIRAELVSRRSNLAREQYAEPYAQPVQMGDDIAAALQGAPGKAAIQRARAAAEAWQDGPVLQELDALQGAIAAGQPMPQVSAAAVDRLRQALSGRGEQLAQRPGTRAVGTGIQNRASQVDAALDNVEGLAPARATYRDMSGQIEALDAGNRFMGANPDDSLAVLRGASDGARQTFRAGMARDIERRAGTTGSAPGVANRLAIPNTPTRQVIDAALGPDDAERLARAARGEREIYRVAQRTNPDAGSQTASNVQDMGRAAGAGADLMGGRPLSAMSKIADMVRRRGFSEPEAEALLEAMYDPDRATEVIDLLASRMTRREARNLVRAIRYQSSVSSQSGPQG